MYFFCKGCDDCCHDCCRGCEVYIPYIIPSLKDCCGGYCDAIAECFSTPFSFCTLISSIVTFVPFILMIVAVLQSSRYDCVENIKTDLIIMGMRYIYIYIYLNIGIANLLNFMFCVYLMCQYGRSYDDEDGVGRDHVGSEVEIAISYNNRKRT
jgi:hypothetical protein